MNAGYGATTISHEQARVQFPQTSVAGEAKREGEILRALQSLVASVNDLVQRVDNLGSRLIPCMAQVPEVGQGVPPTPTYSAPIAVGIANQTNEIAAITHRLDSFLGRIEL